MNFVDQHLCRALRAYLASKSDGGEGYLPLLDRLIEASHPEPLTFPPIDQDLIGSMNADENSN